MEEMEGKVKEVALFLDEWMLARYFGDIHILPISSQRTEDNIVVYWIVGLAGSFVILSTLLQIGLLPRDTWGIYLNWEGRQATTKYLKLGKGRMAGGMAGVSCR